MSDLGSLDLYADNPLNLLLPQPQSQPYSFRWGTVLAVDPLSITLDGDLGIPLDLVPDSLAEVLPGERVLVLRLGTQVIVLGSGVSSGGGPDLTGYVRRNVASDIPDGTADTIYIGGPANTSDSRLRIERLVGTEQFRADTYISGSGTDPVAILAAILNGSMASRLMVRGSGQVQMEKFGTGAHVRPLPFAIASGTVSVAGTGANAATSAVTFPTGRFTAQPKVWTSGNIGSTAALVSMALSVTTAGCTIRLVRDNASGTFSSAYDINWLAMQLEA